MNQDAGNNEFDIDECVEDVGHPFPSWDNLTPEQRAAVNKRIDAARDAGRIRGEGPNAKEATMTETTPKAGWYGWVNLEFKPGVPEKTQVRVAEVTTAGELRALGIICTPETEWAEMADDTVLLGCVTGYLGKRIDWRCTPDGFTPDPEAFYFHGHVGDDEEWKETVAKLRARMIADGWVPGGEQQ